MRSKFGVATKAEDFKAQALLSRSRLNEVCQVNRQLHGMLIKKKFMCESLTQSLDEFNERYERGLKVELPARQMAVKEVEEQIKEVQRKHQAANLDLGHMVMHREEQLAQLSSSTTQLREKSARNRALLKDLHNEVKRAPE